MPTTEDITSQAAEPLEHVSTPPVPVPVIPSTVQSAESMIPIATIQPMPKPPEPLNLSEETPHFLEKPIFVPPNPISQSPKISPSSIPNPSPSVTTTKPVQLSYANYGCYMYSVPVYSAFQPVSYPVLIQANNNQIITDQPAATELVYPLVQTKEKTPPTERNLEQNLADTLSSSDPKCQTDFEEHFTSKVISNIADRNHSEDVKSKVDEENDNLNYPGPPIIKDPNKRMTSERFSLKTSIPISKIDMKCVNNTSDSLQSSLLRKPLNPPFHSTKIEASKIEIQSNVLINDQNLKGASIPTNSISTLITAAEVINQAETQFRKPQAKPQDLSSEHSKNQTCTQPPTGKPFRKSFNPINLETSGPTPASQERSNEQKNKLLLIQNENSSNQKILLSKQQQTPQMLLQRSNVDQKNSQDSSRQSNQTKKSHEKVDNGDGTSSKVVSLKRTHQENCDENDFENLITENQIYGNKIVVKEKLQGTLQEQEIKNNNKLEKSVEQTSQNLVLKPNFVYLSNFQFPTNVMMIQNNVIINNDTIQTPVDNKLVADAATPTTNNNESTSASSTAQETQAMPVLRTNNTNQVLPVDTDIVFQSPSSNVIVSPQIVYQVPMIIDCDSKLSQQQEAQPDESKNEAQVKKNNKPNDNACIDCQKEPKLQPKVSANLKWRTNVAEVSTLDLYENRKRLRRLKHLTHRNTKECKKHIMFVQSGNYINTTEKIMIEVYNELLNKWTDLAQMDFESGSEYEDDDTVTYKKIIDEFAPKRERKGKRKFLAQFRLATHKDYKDREMDRQERILRRDAIASAYITAGRIDCFTEENQISEQKTDNLKEFYNPPYLEETGFIRQRKQVFLAQLKLSSVTKKNRDGFEKIWEEILKERKRREGPSVETKQRTLETSKLKLDTSKQLKLLTKIKNKVCENNKLIKKKIDSHSDAGDSIKILAEKNFSELNRLSKMADISVKHFSGQDANKRDLTPGFDSENIQASKPAVRYIPINVPNIYKTRLSDSNERENSTEGSKPEDVKDDGAKFREASCQTSDNSWPEVEVLIKSYKEYNAARKKEIAALSRRNTALRVESAYVNRNASRDSDRAKALLAERQHLAQEEATVRTSIQKLYAAMDRIKSHAAP